MNSSSFGDGTRHSRSPFAFQSIIFNGFDYPADGLGNHLGLLDRLVFDEMPGESKSLSAIPCLPTSYRYGKVESDLHLRYPERFKNCLFLDVAREAWIPELVREQIQKTVDHKRAFNAVAAVYLMWESDRLWDLYADLITCYDFCIVTSSILDEHLNELGVDFVKLQHPYEFALPGEQPRPRAEKQRFRFGMSAGLWPRKNVLLLAREFLNVFGDDEDVELSIHTRTDVDHHDHKARFSALEELRDQCYRIELICHSFSYSDYIEWMRTLDAYCFVSSGEGYSVTPREALHLKIPVVLHDAHVHREFSHLDGVIRVPSAGTQKASPNVEPHDYDIDIGRDWIVDTKALKRALLDCRNNYAAIQAELIRGYERVLDHHDLAKIKREWIDVLNRKYEQYVNSVRFEYPGVKDACLRSMPAIPADLRLSSPYFWRDTGTDCRDRIYCLKSKHKRGYCVSGPGAPVSESTTLAVTFSLEFVEQGPSIGEVPAELARLEIYDRATNKTVLSYPVTDDHVRRRAMDFTVVVDVFEGQILDFRVYWSGSADISVSGIRIKSAGDAGKEREAEGMSWPPRGAL